MNFTEVFRSFFGLNNNNYSGSNLHNDFRNPIWNIDDDDDTDDELHQYEFSGDFGNGNGRFRLFANPSEMHRVFEEHLNDVLKAFGDAIDSGSVRTSRALQDIPHFHFPAEEETKEKSLRDEYLMPKKSPKDSSRNKVDTDLDGKVTSHDLNSFFRSDGHIEGQVEKFSQNQPSFFGTTIIKKSILLPDGNIETTQTVKSTDGQEETTVTVSPGRGEGRGRTEGMDQIQPFNNILKSFFGF